MDYDIVFFKPTRFEDCMKCIEYIKKDKIVHVNLFGLESDVQQRILDFLSGAIFIQEGKIINRGEKGFSTIPKTKEYYMDYVDKSKVSQRYDEEEEIIPIYK